MTGYENQDGPEISLPAGADLSSYQFHIVTLDTDGYVKLSDDPDDPVECPLGILQNKPTAKGQAAVVRISGTAKVMGGATVAPGIAVSADGSGHMVAATGSDWVVGYTLETTTSGVITTIILKTGSGYSAPA